ncbi:superoxide dismutase family protein [Clostridium sp. MCC353]|uniref:superoxide dismutase family protein n=1 Tax=Clostridium sp. MCC353 TaxID=2592646 RepID=UPI001C037451|nr:superoxide dismutase family protein [Clostridium sp. MCC353]MBT9779864.1 superoxide dismutase family protein [Clostridium sp. MCC353]
MSYQQVTPGMSFVDILEDKSPKAEAWITGGPDHPQLSGLVKFYSTHYGGVLVEAEVFGLPNIQTPGSTDFYAMHIHENGNCSDHFAHTGEHYNPTNQPHPDHAGDLPPLLGNQGYAWTSFYDKRFTVDQIMGRAVIIHQKADDFTSQPD